MKKKLKYFYWFFSHKSAKKVFLKNKNEKKIEIFKHFWRFNEPPLKFVTEIKHWYQNFLSLAIHKSSLQVKILRFPIISSLLKKSISSMNTLHVQARFWNMWSCRSAIERCPSPWNRIRKCPTVTDNGPVKGNDI